MKRLLVGFIVGLVIWPWAAAFVEAEVYGYRRYIMWADYQMSQWVLTVHKRK